MVGKKKNGEDEWQLSQIKLKEKAYEEKVEQLERNNTTKVIEVENTPLGKRNEEEQGWKHSGREE